MYEVTLPEPRWLIIAIAGGMVGLPGFLFTSARLTTQTGATPIVPPSPPPAPALPERDGR